MKMTTGLALALAAGGAHADWIYTTQVDKMNGSTMQIAYVASSNSLNLPSPYTGKNHGRIVVRSAKANGLVVVVQVEKGQFICGVNNCSVLVRFDEKQPTKFRAVPPSDHDPKTLFLEPERQFIDGAKKAKMIRVQATMFHAGEQILEFAVPAPLSWPPPK